MWKQFVCIVGDEFPALAFYYKVLQIRDLTLHCDCIAQDGSIEKCDMRYKLEREASRIPIRLLAIFTIAHPDCSQRPMGAIIKFPEELMPAAKASNVDCSVPMSI